MDNITGPQRKRITNQGRMYKQNMGLKTQHFIHKEMLNVSIRVYKMNPHMQKLSIKVCPHQMT